MHAMKKVKDTGKPYIMSYYKTLGENPEQYKSTVKEARCRGRNLIYRKAYSHCLFIYTVFLLQKILNTKERRIIITLTEAVTSIYNTGLNLVRIPF